MKVSPKLIKDCIRQDRKAQFSLYKLCFPVLMGVCIRYKKNEDEAAGILNAGFLKILNNLKKYQSGVPFEAWIKRIMINTLIDDFRKNKKAKELVEYTDFSGTNWPDNHFELNTADKQFDAEQLERLINLLPPMSKQVFNLYAIDGYSHKEVGKLLNISDGTSKWHLSFARKRLKEMITKTMNSSKVV